MIVGEVVDDLNKLPSWCYNWVGKGRKAVMMGKGKEVRVGEARLVREGE